jgi:hypothetical protein
MAREIPESPEWKGDPIPPEATPDWPEHIPIKRSTLSVTRDIMCLSASERMLIESILGPRCSRCGGALVPRRFSGRPERQKQGTNENTAGILLCRGCLPPPPIREREREWEPEYSRFGNCPDCGEPMSGHNSGTGATDAPQPYCRSCARRGMEQYEAAQNAKLRRIVYLISGGIVVLAAIAVGVTVFLL